MSSVVYDEPVVGTRNRLAARRISWGAVFAGAFVAMATQVTLSMLGLAFGLAAVNPVTEPRPLTALGTGAGLWVGVSALVALFVGGLVAGYLAGPYRRGEGALHGLVTWAFVTIFSIFLISSSVAGLVNSVGNFAATGTPSERVQVRQELQAVQPTQQQLEQTAESGGTASFLAFVGLVLGAAAASAGGLVGAPRVTGERLPPPEHREPERVTRWHDAPA